MGERGEYSDRCIWSVAAYTDRTMAEEHARRADAWCRDVQKKAEDDWTYEKPDRNPFDTSMPSWGHDAEYHVSLLFLHENIDAYATTENVLTDYCKEQGWLP